MKKPILKAIAVIAGVLGITAVIYCLTERVPKCLDCEDSDDGWCDEEEDSDIASEYDEAMDTSTPGEE